jgi:hypothetical protein
MAIDVDLADDLVDLGAALGLFTNGDGPATVNESWFADPGRHMGAVFADPDQRAALLALAARRLGDPTGDLDVQDLPEGQQWVALASTPSGGLFLVVEDEGESAVLGLGVRAGSPADPKLAVTAHVPLIRAGGTGAGFVTGTEAGTIGVAVSVAPAAGSGVALDSGALDMRVPTDGRPASFTIDLEGLRVDGAAPPRDIHVDSSEPAVELLDLALSVLQRLVLNTAADSQLGHLLALAGLGGGSELPALSLADVVADGGAALSDWLRRLTADTSQVRTWVAHLAELLGLSALTAVSGDGSVAAPLVVTFDVGSATVGITLTVATAPATGERVLRPGVRVRMPAPAAFPGRAEAAVELAEITLGSGVDARPLPSARAVAHLGPDVPLAAGADPLVDTTAPDGSRVTITALEAGMGIDAARRPVLVLAAREVSIVAPQVGIGTHEYEVVDLTMPDAVREVVQDALEDVVDGLLATLGSSTEATALLALLGLRRPAGLAFAAPWPHATSLTAFFADPLGAVAGFHADVLAGGNWGTLLGELATLLRGGAATAIGGDGTAASPWSADVAADALGTAALIAWVTGGTQLRVGLRLRAAPVALSADTELRPAIEAELLELEIGGDPRAEVLPAVGATLELGEGLPLDLGIVELELGSVAASLRWRRAEGLALRLEITDAVATVGDERIALPVPPYDSGEDLPALPADFPWTVITRLLGDALMTRGVDWLEGLATLAHWNEGLPVGVATPPPGVDLGLLTGLPVERLPGDPAGVLRDWVAELLRDIQGGAATRIAAWIGAITAGTAPGGGAFGVDLGGGGTAADPYSAGLGNAADAAELLVWFEPDGTTLGGVPELILPAELTAPLDLLEGDPPGADTLAELLRQAARSIPELRALVDGRPGLGHGLDQLIARLADSDVFVPAASQGLAGAVAAYTVDGLTHLEAPLGFDPAVHLPADTDPAHVLYVAEDLPGLADWPDRGAAPLIDLSERGLAPEAMDVSGAAAAGPWFVRLATRAAAGDAQRQAARLQRVVTTAAATLPAGAALTVVAHGPAALAARRVASAPDAGIGHLVTLAAPLAGATFEFLDEPSSGDAIRTLQSLAPLLSAEARENPFVADGLAIVETLTGLLDDEPGERVALDDYRLAGPAESLAAGVGATTVTVTFGAPTAARAIASLVRHAIEPGRRRRARGAGPAWRRRAGAGQDRRTRRAARGPASLQAARERRGQRAAAGARDDRDPARRRLARRRSTLRS